MKKIKINIKKEVLNEGEFRHGGTRVNPFTTADYKNFPNGIPPSEMDRENDHARAMEAVNNVLDLMRQLYEEEFESVDSRYIPEVERDARHVIQNFVVGFAKNLKHFRKKENRVEPDDHWSK